MIVSRPFLRTDDGKPSHPPSAFLQVPARRDGRPENYSVSVYSRSQHEASRSMLDMAHPQDSHGPGPMVDGHMIDLREVSWFDDSISIADARHDPEGTILQSPEDKELCIPLDTGPRPTRSHTFRSCVRLPSWHVDMRHLPDKFRAARRRRKLRKSITLKGPIDPNDVETTESVLLNGPVLTAKQIDRRRAELEKRLYVVKYPWLTFWL